MILSFINNIRQVPQGVLKTSAVNEWKIMFDPYIQTCNQNMNVDNN